MVIVRQILKAKENNQVFSVTPETSILDVLRLMADKEIGAVLVMEGIKVVGIFSERDYARRGVLKGRTVESPVSESMTRIVYYVGPDQTTEECMAQMTDKRIRHLPVVEEGKVIGVISIGDVVKAIIADQKDQIKGMENYILGRGYNQG
jgi:CBS domain-containing protein